MDNGSASDLDRILYKLLKGLEERQIDIGEWLTPEEVYYLAPALVRRK